jgi:ferritin-like metal-binding protein YciE
MVRFVSATLSFASPEGCPMASTKRDDVIAWLRDAHAMEAAHVDSLDRLIRLSDEYPQLKNELQKHHAISIKQRDEIEQELARFDSRRSILKDWTMKFTGQIEPFVSRFTQDSIPKNCLLAHAYEAFEIAAYRALLGAAEELDMEELRSMCERYIREEQDMANFLFEHLPQITSQYLRTRGA